MTRPGSGSGELARKAIHALLSVPAALAVGTLEPVPAALVLAAATLAALAVELARRTSPGFGRLFRSRLGRLLKDGETDRLTGATTLAMGFTVSALLLPGRPALAGILFAGLADPAAAVAGRRFGRYRYPGGKSVAGSAVFFVVALMAALGLGLGPVAGVVAAALATAAEAPALRVDDNLYLPLAGAGAVVLASWLTTL